MSLANATVAKVGTPHNVVTNDAGRVISKQSIVTVTGASGDTYETGGIALIETAALEAELGYSKITGIHSVYAQSGALRLVPDLNADGQLLNILSYNNDDDAETDDATSLDTVVIVATVEGY